MARPEAKIDLVELEKLCGMQCTDEEIAAFFGVSKRTIERRRKVDEVPRDHGSRQGQGPGFGSPEPVPSGSRRQRRRRHLPRQEPARLQGRGQHRAQRAGR